MRHTFLLLAVLLVTSPALAQTGDEWTTFPPTPAPAEEPKKEEAPPPAADVPPAAAPAVAPSPTTPAASAAAKQRVEDRLAGKTEEAAPSAADANLRLVSEKSRFEPGTEPHSPATRDFVWNAPENARVMMGTLTTGTLLVPSARMGPKGVVRVGFTGEYLNIADFPVKTAQDIRSAITFAASFQFTEWGEAYVAYGAAANTNNRTSPNLIQALGDVSLGFKGGYEVTNGLWVGGDLRLLSFSGVGNQGIDRFAFGIRPTALVTYDVRKANRNLPLLATLGLGVTIDSSGGLVQNQKLNASEEFALGVNEYNRFNAGLGLEVPLPWASPFIEYNLGVPFAGNLTGPDGNSVSVTQAMPQTLGLGARVTALKDLTLLAGVNLGLTQRVGLGVPATAPWNLYLGASFAIDPFQRGETRILDRLQERTVKEEVEAPAKTARVTGTVLDAETNQPLQGVIVAAGSAPPSATDAQGRFTTLELAEPQVTLTATREGYKPAEQAVPLKPGEAAQLELKLTPDVKKANFAITVLGKKKKAVAAAVSFGGASDQTANTVADAAAPLAVEVPAGQYTVSVTAEGYLSKTRDVQVQPGGTMELKFELEAEPKKKLVVFKGDKIEILQQVHFATGKSTIIADSFSLLNQVVDAVVKNNVKRVRVEGHTDNRGKKDRNQKLSEDRARAVADYLISQGIDASRLESVGYGDSRPIAPNLTARGRELNRRVEFVVLEK